MNLRQWWANQPADLQEGVAWIGCAVVVGLLVATCEGCTPATLTVRLDRVPGGERATISLDGEPAVALSSATTLTVEEP